MRNVLPIVVALTLGLTGVGCAGGPIDAGALSAQASQIRESNDAALAEIATLRAGVVPGSKEDQLLAKAETGLQKVGAIAEAAQGAVNEDGTVNAGGIAAALTALAPGPLGTGLGLAFILGSGIYNAIQRKRIKDALDEAALTGKALTETVTGVKAFMRSAAPEAVEAMKSALVGAQDGSTQLRVAAIRYGVTA